MRALKHPQGGLGRTLVKLIKAKRGHRRATLLAIIPLLQGRYRLYVKSRKALETVPAVFWAAADAEALRHSYSSGSSTLSEIKESVFKCLDVDERVLCPYCLLRPPEDCDHYLGAARFPEFSTLRINLIWVCGKCNTIKGDRFTNAPRSVLNPYFDPIPSDIPLLYCRVTIVGNALTIKFGIPSTIRGVSANVITVARRHCVTFSLDKAYIAEASAMLASWLRELAARFPQGMSQAELTAEIGYQLARSSGLEPINSWYSAIWFGVQNCPGLHTYVLGFIAAQPVRPLQATAPRHADLLNWF